MVMLARFSLVSRLLTFQFRSKRIFILDAQTTTQARMISDVESTISLRLVSF